ncbi:hypothetical protein [Streptomyces tauricus]|uniref:hypothetical protein n=1 Tax=Streptomyces tauricus TaxID=68274 RepID=UPI00382E4D96
MSVMDIVSFEEEPARPGPGRRLNPLADTVTPEHREWLVPLRVAFLESGLTYKDLCLKALTSPAQLSRLLNGMDGYPDLERTLNLRNVLQCALDTLAQVEPLKPVPNAHGVILHRPEQSEPTKPVQSLQGPEWFRKVWEAGAVAAGRPERWVRDRIAEMDRKEAAARRAELVRKVVDFSKTSYCLFVCAFITSLLLVVLMGSNWGAPGPSTRQSPVPPQACAESDTGTCQVSVPSPDLLSPPSRREEPEAGPVEEDLRYFRFPEVTNTAGYQEWVVTGDTLVHDRAGLPTGEYARAGEFFYVSCVTDDNYLVIANSVGMSVWAGDALSQGGPIEARPCAAQPEASSRPTPPPTP